jgi:peptidoglycan/LPS O-acetylase OafA/YrhL
MSSHSGNLVGPDLRGSPGPERLAFLDVLRGLAASLVVLEHGLEVCIPGYLDFSIRYFDLGQFGVTLFLLISGFIIPVSLERGRSNPRFWVNRFFRLFPLYWATIAFFFAYYQLAHPEALHPPRAWQWLVNCTMFQDFLGVPHVAQVFWTLTLELTFYACCSLLYGLGLLGRTRGLVCLGQAALLVLGVVAPLLLGRRFPGGYGFLFLTMFLGTLFYRRAAGEVSRWGVSLLLGALLLLSLAVAYVSFTLFPRAGHSFTTLCVWAGWLSAYLIFGLTLARRELPMPAFLAYLGRISYSIYLVHTWILLVLPQHWPPLFYLSSLLGGTLAGSVLTFHAIERPFMTLGKRLLGKNRPDTRSTPPAFPGSEPSPMNTRAA